MKETLQNERVAKKLIHLPCLQTNKADLLADKIWGVSLNLSIEPQDNELKQVELLRSKQCSLRMTWPLKWYP